MVQPTALDCFARQSLQTAAETWPHAIRARERLHEQLQQQRRAQDNNNAGSSLPMKKCVAGGDTDHAPSDLLAQVDGGDAGLRSGHLCGDIRDILCNQHAAASEFVVHLRGEFTVVADVGDTFSSLTFDSFVVGTVEPTSWAALQGVRPFDELLAINGRSVQEFKAKEFMFFTRRIRPLKLRFIRVPAELPIADNTEDGQKKERRQIRCNLPTASSHAAHMSTGRQLQEASFKNQGQSCFGDVARMTPPPSKGPALQGKSRAPVVPWRNAWPSGEICDVKGREPWLDSQYKGRRLSEPPEHTAKEAFASRLRCGLAAAKRSADLLADVSDLSSLAAMDTRGEIHKIVLFDNLPTEIASPMRSAQDADVLSQAGSIGRPCSEQHTEVHATAFTDSGETQDNIGMNETDLQAWFDSLAGSAETP